MCILLSKAMPRGKDLEIFMEELIQAATGYYHNGSNDRRNLASKFFKSMDTNGDNKVSRSECDCFLKENGYNISRRIFDGLDRNRDGYLNFSEVMAVYYIIKTRLNRCAKCEMRLLGMYFTCVTCFDRLHTGTYDLCTNCYSARRFDHSHSVPPYFLDTHTLLLSKREARGSNLKYQQELITARPPPSVSMQQARINDGHTQAIVRPTRAEALTLAKFLKQIAFCALEAAVGTGIASIVASCTIM